MAAQDPAAIAAAAAIAALPKPVIVSCDMPPEAAQKCFELAGEALTQQKVEKDQAMHMKKGLEAWNGCLWHVIVGQSFGASVAHEVHAFILFKIGKTNILCFQSYDEAQIINGGEKKQVQRAVAKQEEKEDEGGAE